MFQKNYYVSSVIKSGFGDDRGSYLHSGIDPVGTKSDEIVCLVNGIVVDISYNHKWHGQRIVLKSNFKFAKGVNDVIYTRYCHMHNIKNIVLKELVYSGDIIGNMGNSGYCLTYDNGKWRELTDEEKYNSECQKGVHLHLSFHQNVGAYKKTKLLNELIRLKLVPKTFDSKYYFWQWNKLFIAPRVIYQYFEYLKSQS